MTSNSRVACFATVCIVALGAGIDAANPELVVAAGRSVSLMTLSSIDQARHALGPVTVSVIEQPRGGYLELSQTKAYPNFNMLKSRARGNTLKLPATRVWYQSAGNFLGLDSVTVDAVYPEGGVKRIRIAVSVRPIAPPPVSRTDSPPEHANADVPGYPTPEGPSTELAPQVVPRAKPRVRHAEAQARMSERHGCKTPRTTGKAPVAAHPEAKPVEPKTMLTPI